MEFVAGRRYRVVSSDARLLVRVALGMGRFGSTPISVPPGTELECAGGIVGDGGPAVGWKLSTRQRADAELIVSTLSIKQGFAELASELVGAGRALAQLVEPVDASGEH